MLPGAFQNLQLQEYQNLKQILTLYWYDVKLIEADHFLCLKGLICHDLIIFLIYYLKRIIE